MNRNYTAGLTKWLDLMEGEKNTKALHSMLAKDCVFYSPVVHTPQKGQVLTSLYLMGAAQVLGVNSSFRYTRILDCFPNAVLEFETEVDGIFINGVDIIRWNEDGLIEEFKVMLRPLKAVNMVHQKMAEMLEAMKAPAKT